MKKTALLALAALPFAASAQNVTDSYLAFGSGSPYWVAYFKLSSVADVSEIQVRQREGIVATGCTEESASEIIWSTKAPFVARTWGENDTYETFSLVGAPQISVQKYSMVGGTTYTIQTCVFDASGVLSFSETLTATAIDD